jgi:TolB-like protein
VFGEVLAEEIIRLLSRSPYVHVISRLSTTAFRGREITPAQISTHLNANYVLSGVYHVSDKKITVDAELEEARSNRIVWSQRLEDQVGNTFSGQQELIGRAAAEVYAAMMSRELQRARSQALPTLESYTLLMSGIALMHRMSLPDFEDAYKMLQTVVDRAGRQSIPQAWIAKWHVLRVQQGWSEDPKRDAHHALECTKQALDADPDCSLALAIDGLVHTQMFKRLDIAQERYERAVLSNPSDSIAWLLKGTMHAFMGAGQLAVDHTERAIKLSPLDPHRYFYDSLAATAHLAYSALNFLILFQQVNFAKGTQRLGKGSGGQRAAEVVVVSCARCTHSPAHTTAALPDAREDAPLY